MKTQTRNALVNIETDENYGEKDVHGIWEVTIEKGKAEVAYIGGMHVETIVPSGYCENLDDFEQELSDQFGNEMAFSGLTEDERKIQDAWVKLQSVVQSGSIIHVEHTDEEFLTDFDEFYLYIASGLTSDWEDVEGVEIDENGSYPDGHGGYSEGKVYIQKNLDVNNPVNEYPGWEDNFELIEGSNGYFFICNMFSK